LAQAEAWKNRVCMPVSRRGAPAGDAQARLDRCLDDAQSAA